MAETSGWIHKWKDLFGTTKQITHRVGARILFFTCWPESILRLYVLYTVGFVPSSILASFLKLDLHMYHTGHHILWNWNDLWCIEVLWESLQDILKYIEAQRLSHSWILVLVWFQFVHLCMCECGVCVYAYMHMQVCAASYGAWMKEQETGTQGQCVICPSTAGRWAARPDRHMCMKHSDPVLLLFVHSSDTRMRLFMCPAVHLSPSASANVKVYWWRRRSVGLSL